MRLLFIGDVIGKGTRFRSLEVGNDGEMIARQHAA